MSREPDSREFEITTEATEAKRPKWPLNLQGLIAWLETQDPETKYNWSDVDSCLIARFLVASTGSRRGSGDYNNVCGGVGNYHFIGCNNHGHPTGGKEHADWTFGEALARAKHVQKWL
jgi:hypothetical protein